MADTPGTFSAVAVLGQVEPEVESDLEQHEHDDRRRGRPGHADQERPDDDRDVEDDQPAVRREHLLGGGRSQVFTAADVVQAVRHAVADEETDHDEKDRQRVRGRPEVGGSVGTAHREKRQQQHEEAVDHPEDAVVHDEERDQGRLVGAARRATVDLEATEPPPGLRHFLGRVFARSLGLPHLQDVEQPVDAVLEPVDDEDPPDIPAEPQDADEWDEVGQDQGGDGRVRGPDLVEGDQPLHRHRC